MADDGLIVRLEAIAEAALNPATATREIQQAVIAFQSSPQSFSAAQQLLEKTTNVSALVFASNSLLTLLTNFFPRFTPQQTVDMRTYLLNYLAQRVNEVPGFVLDALVKTLVRLTKLAWEMDQQHKELATTAVPKFLQHSVSHCLLGLQILLRLVEEMNSPVGHEGWSQHRRVAGSFRDRCLLFVFQLALTTLKQVVTKQVKFTKEGDADRMLGSALSLAVKCLTFDYVGVSPDESSEEARTIHIPANWKSVIEDPATVQLFFELYHMTRNKPEYSSKALECLAELAAARRSLFVRVEDRVRYLSSLIAGAQAIMAGSSPPGGPVVPSGGSTAGIGALASEPDNFHQFCRFLWKLNANFSIDELLMVDRFDEFLKGVAAVSTASFRSYDELANSVHYVLGFWSRLATALPDAPKLHEQVVMQRPELFSLVDTVISMVFEAFLQTKLQAVPRAVQRGELAELFEETELMDQLRHLPILARYNYRTSTSAVKNLYDPLVQALKAAIVPFESMGPGTPLGDEHVLRLSTVEAQLAIVIYALAAVIGEEKRAPAIGKAEMVQLDAMLAAAVFNLLPLTDFRSKFPHLSIPKATYLDQAIIFFLANFRKRFFYIGTERPDFFENKEGSGTIFSEMSKHMGSITGVQILNAMLHAIVSNLVQWPNEPAVLKAALNLFEELTTSFSTSNLLPDLEAARSLIHNHMGERFQFQRQPGNTRATVQFYTVLARIAFKRGVHSRELFDALVAPLEKLVDFLRTAPDQKSEACSVAAITLCTALRGICAGAVSHEAYNMFWEWLYPRYLGTVLRLAETWYDTHQVSTPVLKFVAELVHNKAHRITWPLASANGVILFKEVSKLLQIYAPRALALAKSATGSGGSQELYKRRLKGLSLCFLILGRALSGDFCCFGVFALYGDRALTQALDVTVNLFLSVPMRDILMHTDVAVNYFSFVEALMKHHTGSDMGEALSLAVDSL